jgi:hypothetical protein
LVQRLTIDRKDALLKRSGIGFGEGDELIASPARCDVAGRKDRQEQRRASDLVGDLAAQFMVTL